jgi:hypothetical protein
MQPDVVRAKRDEDALFDFIGKQADAAEGVRAFLEKREPAWSLSATRDLPASLSDWPED